MFAHEATDITDKFMLSHTSGMAATSTVNGCHPSEQTEYAGLAMMPAHSTQPLIDVKSNSISDRSRNTWGFESKPMSVDFTSSVFNGLVDAGRGFTEVLFASDNLHKGFEFAWGAAKIGAKYAISAGAESAAKTAAQAILFDKLKLPGTLTFGLGYKLDKTVSYSLKYYDLNTSKNEVLAKEIADKMKALEVEVFGDNN